MMIEFLVDLPKDSVAKKRWSVVRQPNYRVPYLSNLDSGELLVGLRLQLSRFDAQFI
jgi:hypothetical protein